MAKEYRGNEFYLRSESAFREWAEQRYGEDVELFKITVKLVVRSDRLHDLEEGQTVPDIVEWLRYDEMESLLYTETGEAVVLRVCPDDTFEQTLVGLCKKYEEDYPFRFLP